MRGLVFLLAFIVSAGPFASPRAHSDDVAGSRDAQSFAITLFERYEQGDHDGATRAAAAVANWKTLARDIAADAPGWIAADGGDRSVRRRLMVATFIIETAYASYVGGRLEGVAAADRSRKWQLQRPLIEWACALLRSVPEASEAERRWHLALFELAKFDPVFLVGPPADASLDRAANLRIEYGTAIDHAAHARSRFPSDRAMQLLEVEARHSLRIARSRVASRREVSVERFAELQREAAAVRLRRSHFVGSDVALRTPRDADLLAEVDALTRLQHAARALRDLEQYEQIRGDVSLELGIIAMCFADRVQAVDYLGQAEDRSHDPRTRYLSALFLGRLHHVEGRSADAEAAFRRALAVYPGAQSATIGLSMLLLSSGRRSEASSFVERSIAGVTDNDDPWFTFVDGAPDRWHILIRHVRESLQ